MSIFETEMPNFTAYISRRYELAKSVQSTVFHCFDWSQLVFNFFSCEDYLLDSNPFYFCSSSKHLRENWLRYTLGKLDGENSTLIVKSHYTPMQLEHMKYNRIAMWFTCIFDFATYTGQCPMYTNRIANNLLVFFKLCYSCQICYFNNNKKIAHNT